MIEYININGIDFPIYYLFYFMSFPVCVTFNALYYRQKYHLGNVLKTVFATMLSFNLIYCILMITYWLILNVNMHGMNFVRVIGLLPLVYVVIGKISMKTSIKDLVDFGTPASGLGYMITHLGCIFPGCCHGYPIENYPHWIQWMGIYSNYAERICFPIQIIESIAYGVIALIIVVWAKYKKYKTNGKAYGLFLILFGISRFLLEFLRDNEKIIAGLSEYSFWAIGWFVVGIIWYGIITIKEIKSNKANVAYN